MNDADQIATRLAAAPTGPWEWRNDYPQQIFAGDGITLVAETYYGDRDSVAPEAEFIAHAPDDIAYLLAQRASVLEQHKPDSHDWGTVCRRGDGVWPCATVKALGVTE